MNYWYKPVLSVVIVFWSGLSVADEVEIVKATAAKSSGSWRFDVTLKHADTGWQHYANKWEIVTADGKVLGTRVLYHPHVDEQPFTRSLSGVDIPAGTKEVVIRAYDLKHGRAVKAYKLVLPK